MVLHIKQVYHWIAVHLYNLSKLMVKRSVVIRAVHLLSQYYGQW